LEGSIVQWTVATRLTGVLGIVLGLGLSACGGGGGSQQPAPDPVPKHYRVSGSATSVGGMLVDSDVNDPNTARVSNNTFSESQIIDIPGTIGGYANVPGAGPAGSSRAEGDTNDWFRVDLEAGMRLTLHVASEDPVADDLDLYLYAAADPSTPVDAAVGTASTESLSVPADGSYYVVVRAASGASNYLLSIGLGTPATQLPGALRLSDPFVPGDIVAKLKDAPTIGTSRAAQPRAAVALRNKAGGRGRPMLFGLEDQERDTPQGLRRSMTAPADEPAAEVAGKLETLLAIKEMRRRGDVEYAEPNYLRQTHAAPNDPHYRVQWHYAQLNLPHAWDISTGSRAGDPVVVAVVDSGVLRNHPDMKGVLVPGYDFIRSTTVSRDGDGIDADADDVGDSTTGRSSFHGTHVAGTVAAASNNGIGAAGVSWGARIMPLRALGAGGGTSYDVQQAVRFAAGLPNDSGTLPERKADIINLSLGGPGASQAEQDLYAQVRSAGVIVIAAAGNANSDAPFYPASYDGVVSVSALDMNKNRAPYSNYGSRIDVAAPGGDTGADRNGDGYADGVLSTMGNDSDGTIRFTYGFYQGTSMAAPHVAGVAALMRAIDPEMTPAEFDAALADGSITHDLGTVGRDDTYGHGLIDAYKAVLKAQELAGLPATPAPAKLAVSPGSLNFGNQVTSTQISLTNAGSGSLTVDAVTDSADWLTVTPASIDGDGLGTYTVTVSRDGLAEGSHSASITFTSSNNTLTVPVIMQVGRLTANAGHQYILLLDAATMAPVAQVSGDALNGSYPFSFSGVAPGSYYLAAGTDANNDGFICDGGEACGAYPTLSDPAPITIAEDSSGLDFATGFDQAFSAPAAAPALGTRIRRLPVSKEATR
jgi:serine protease